MFTHSQPHQVHERAINDADEFERKVGSIAYLNDADIVTVRSEIQKLCITTPHDWRYWISECQACYMAGSPLPWQYGYEQPALRQILRAAGHLAGRSGVKLTVDAFLSAP